MALDFPAAPTIGQIFDTGDRDWQWDGVKWKAFGTGGGGSGGGCTADSIPPPSPSSGDLWYDTNTGRTYIWYDDVWSEVTGVPSSPNAADLLGTTMALNVVNYPSGMTVGGKLLGGVLICTSATRPSPFDGCTIYETDTKRTVQYTTSKWTILNEPWHAWTPSLSSTGGSGVTGTINHARYSRHGETVEVSLNVSITAVGTATGHLIVTMPPDAPNTGSQFVGSGRELSAVGISLLAYGSGVNIGVCKYDNGSPMVVGYTLSLSGLYYSAVP